MKRLLLIFSLCALSFSCCAQKFTVKVVAISDGDTFTGINADNLQLKIRINGIDAPEKKQAFGKKSKEFLSSLIFGKYVSVDVQSQDRYGRFISVVYTPDGEDVALLMLREGMAWHFVWYDDNEVYSAAEATAREEKRGLWVDSEPMAPWDYRYNRRNKIR